MARTPLEIFDRDRQLSLRPSEKNDSGRKHLLPSLPCGPPATPTLAKRANARSTSTNAAPEETDCVNQRKKSMSTEQNSCEPLSLDEFAHLGQGAIAYVKPIRSEEVATLFPQAPAIEPGIDLFVLL